MALSDGEGQGERAPTRRSGAGLGPRACRRCRDRIAALCVSWCSCLELLTWLWAGQADQSIVRLANTGNPAAPGQAGTICRPASAQGITKNSPYAAHKLGGLAERPCTVTRAILIPVPGTRSTPLSSYLPEVRQRSAGRHHECHSSGTFRLPWYPVRCSKIHYDLEPPYGIEP